jgi:hypothetical protein
MREFNELGVGLHSRATARTATPDSQGPTTRATLAHDAVADEYREAILKRWGPRALVSLAFPITAARIYPTAKYALGHGKACTRVVVGGTTVMFDHGRVPSAADVAVRTA